MRQVLTRCALVVGVGLACRDSVAQAPASSDAGAGKSPYFTLEKVSEHVWATVAVDWQKTICNSMIAVTDREVLIADSHMTEESARDLVRVVKTITDKPIRYLVHTHYHGDHVNGSPVFGPEVEVVGHVYTKDRLAEHPPGGNPAARLPTYTLTETWALHRPGLTVRVLFLGRAHTAGDVVVQVVEEGVLMTGDACVNGPYTFWGDAFPLEWGPALDRMAALKAKKVVPGHGPVADGDLIPRFKGYVESVLAAVKPLVDAGKSFEETKAAAELPADLRFWTGAKEGEKVKPVDHQTKAAYEALRQAKGLPPRVGDPAPDFTLPSSAGGSFHLVEQNAKGPVVLTTYLLDFTGG